MGAAPEFLHFMISLSKYPLLSASLQYSLLDTLQDINKNEEFLITSRFQFQYICQGEEKL